MLTLPEFSMVESCQVNLTRSRRQENGAQSVAQTPQRELSGKVSLSTVFEGKQLAASKFHMSEAMCTLRSHP